MRATISYSVNFDDLPEKIAGLISEAIEELSNKAVKDLSCAHKEIQQNNNVNASVKKIDNVREKLADIDTRLSECTNILLGYQKALIDSSMLDSPPGVLPHETNNVTAQDFNKIAPTEDNE